VKTVLVSAAICIEGGRVLLTQRKAGGHLAGAWEFPGGKVESGEDPRDALRRELVEELGIECTIGECADVTFHRYEDEDQDNAVLLLFFDAVRVKGDPQPLDVAAFKWAGPGDLDPALFPPADVGILAKVRERLRANPRQR
jgi:8-oxo-dGTP diphosphatase